MFLPSAALSSSATTRYDYIQAAEAPAMESLFTAYIVALIAENSTRAAQQLPALNVIDVDIAGGGDGHTFVVRIFVSANVPPLTAWVGGPGGSLSRVQGKFWLGSNAEALEAYQEAAIASLLTNQSPVDAVAVGLAGAAKGTRFMAFVAGAIASGG